MKNMLASGASCIETFSGAEVPVGWEKKVLPLDTGATQAGGQDGQAKNAEPVWLAPHSTV